MRIRRPQTSLRVRLTLAFAAAMAVVLTGVAVFVYLSLRTDLRASVDSGLAVARAGHRRQRRARRSGAGRPPPPDRCRRGLRPGAQPLGTDRRDDPGGRAGGARAGARAGEPPTTHVRGRPPPGPRSVAALDRPGQRRGAPGVRRRGRHPQRQPGGAGPSPDAVRRRLPRRAAPVIADRLAAGGRRPPPGRADAARGGGDLGVGPHPPAARCPRPTTRSPVSPSP